MPEKDLTLKFKVTDEGTVVLDKISSNIQKIDKSVSSMNTSLGGIKVASIVYLGEKVLAAANQVYDFSRAIASSANEIKKQSDIIGMSISTYQGWTFAAKMADVPIENLQTGLKFLSRNMSEASQGLGMAKNAFAAMGISVNQAGGGLKPLDTMMKEIMDKFAGWADGPQKIALALALFGRSGQELIPLLNKGSVGFAEFAKKAAELGIILDPKLIEAGSRAEDSFKKINAQLEAGKLHLTPFAEGFASLVLGMLEKLNEFKSWVSANPKIWGFITGAIIPAPINIAVGLLTGKGAKKETIDLSDYGLSPTANLPPAPAPVDFEAIAKRRLTLEKELLSVGFQTTAIKMKELEIDRQLDILEASKSNEGKQFISLINQINDARKKQLEYEDRLVRTADQYRIEETYFIDELKTEYDIRDKMRDIQQNIDKSKASAGLAYAQETGDLKLIEQAENDIWELEKKRFKGSQDEINILDKTLKLRQTTRQIETTAGQETTILNFEKQYLELLSQHSNNIKDLIDNTKALEDVEIARLTKLRDELPALEDFYQTQIDLIKKVGEEIRNQMANREIVDATTDVARSMSSAWSSGLIDMINGTMSFSDSMKKIFTDMGNIIIKKLLEIAMNYALMGNITGNKVTGGLFGGIGNLGTSISNLISGPQLTSSMSPGLWISGAAEGGITGPLLAHYPLYAYQGGGIARSPQIGIFGEAGAEAFVPLRGGKIPVETKGSKGDTYVTYIQATDVGSFAKLYGPAIESIYYKGRRFNKVSMR